MIADQIRTTFEDLFGREPQLLVRSSGRINLIGEHTDYNGGFVLPAAIEQSIYFAISARTDQECHFVAYNLEESFTTHLDQLLKTSTNTWANYLMGVINEIQKTLKNKNLLPVGVNLVFGGDLPSGGGMSSSAAIENGMGLALNELFGLKLTNLDLVAISQQAENNFVGMRCGIMDMFASMMGLNNQFVRIDCRDLSYQYYPFAAPELRLVLCDTTVKHALVDSEYNTRRAECEEGVKVLHRFDGSIENLRDVPLTLLEENQNELRPIVYQRCKYVIEENTRVKQACSALEQQDYDQLGQLMYATHEGLSKAYEVSCEELDFLVDNARQVKGVLGARMMGGGFGGCTINLVQTSEVEAFIKALSEAYMHQYKTRMPSYILKLSNGTEVIHN